MFTNKLIVSLKIYKKEKEKKGTWNAIGDVERWGVKKSSLRRNSIFACHPLVFCYL